MYHFKQTARFFSLFFILVVSANTFAETQRAGYEGKWGVRLSFDTVAYVGFGDALNEKKQKEFSPLGSGLLLPLQLESTYSITNALEIFLGLRYGIQGASLIYKYSHPLESIGALVGYRYFFNVHEPVKFYFSGQLRTAFLRPALDAGMNAGFQWDITDDIGVFVQNGVALALNLDPVTFAPSYSLGTGVAIKF